MKGLWLTLLLLSIHQRLFRGQGTHAGIANYIRRGGRSCDETVVLGTEDAALFDSSNYPENFDKFSECKRVYQSSLGTSLEMFCSNIDLTFLTHIRVNNGELTFRVSSKDTFITSSGKVRLVLPNEVFLAKGGASCRILSSTGSTSTSETINSGTQTISGTTKTETSSEAGTTEALVETETATADSGITDSSTENDSGSSSTSNSESGDGSSGEAVDVDPKARCKCGQSSGTRIVGGQEADRNEYPWIAALIRKGQTPEMDKHFCGGSLITRETVLTAAHCTLPFTPSRIFVRLGVHQLSNVNEGIRRDVLEIIRHPEYHVIAQHNDFSILKIQSVDFNFYTNIRPVCLPLPTSPLYDNKEAVVIGWGKNATYGSTSDTLQEVVVNVVDNAKCQEAYPTNSVTDHMLCASARDKDSCQGDSGGPLLYQTTGRFFEAIGVVSWGIGCADPQFHGVYARVTSVLPWIAAHTNSAMYCSRPSS